MTAIRTSRKRLAPRWLTTGDGELIGYSLDLVKDAFIERARLGLLARLPQNNPAGTRTAPADALNAIGRSRRILRGISETDASYAARLVNWLDDWRKAGSAFEMMHQLAGYCGPLPSFRTVDDRGNWYSRTAAGVESSSLVQENWDWDDEAIGAKWARFWVIIYPGGLWTAETYTWGDGSDPVWGAGTDTHGLTMTPEHAVSLRSIVDTWKPEGTRCISIIVSLDAGAFDPTTPEPDGTWRNWGVDDAGTRVPARLATARYIDR